MILQIVIDIVLEIAKSILQLIEMFIPQVNLAEYMATYTLKIISICTQANNFIHFIVGDFVVVLVPIALALLIYKYTAYPILTLIRSIFINGNN